MMKFLYRLAMRFCLSRMEYWNDQAELSRTWSDRFDADYFYQQWSAMYSTLLGKVGM